VVAGSAPDAGEPPAVRLSAAARRPRVAAAGLGRRGAEPFPAPRPGGFLPARVLRPATRSMALALARTARQPVGPPGLHTFVYGDAYAVEVGTHGFPVRHVQGQLYAVRCIDPSGAAEGSRARR
jgi:hypothetical protein